MEKLNIQTKKDLVKGDIYELPIGYHNGGAIRLKYLGESNSLYIFWEELFDREISYPYQTKYWTKDGYWVAKWEEIFDGKVLYPQKNKMLYIKNKKKNKI